MGAGPQSHHPLACEKLPRLDTSTNASGGAVDGIAVEIARPMSAGGSRGSEQANQLR
jgi:hypothetical protein